MHTIDILLTGELSGGTDPFRQGDLHLQFHKWTAPYDLPALDGTVWAFVDRVLPDMSGLEICRRLRCDPRAGAARITMVLEGEDTEIWRRALRAVADDYVIGPVDREALLSRVLAGVQHKFPLPAQPVMTLGDLTVDQAAFQARWQGKIIPVMPNEFRLLRYLVENQGRVFTRSQLIAAVGKGDISMDERTVDVWVGRLRRALNAVGAGHVLRTVRSIGYIIDTP